MPLGRDSSYYDYLDNKYDGDMKSKHVPSEYDEEFDREYAEDLKYEEYEKNKIKNENEEKEENDTSNCDSDDYGITIKYTDYTKLLDDSNQEDTSDKIYNIINALITLIISNKVNLKKNNEIWFKYDFTLGSLEKWVEKASVFNKWIEDANLINNDNDNDNDNDKDNIYNDYKILLDEEHILCALITK